MSGCPDRAVGHKERFKRTGLRDRVPHSSPVSSPQCDPTLGSMSCMPWELIQELWEETTTAMSFSGCKTRGQGRHQLTPITCPSSIMSWHLCWARSCPLPSYIQHRVARLVGLFLHHLMKTHFFLLSASRPRNSSPNSS